MNTMLATAAVLAIIGVGAAVEGTVRGKRHLGPYQTWDGWAIILVVVGALALVVAVLIPTGTYIGRAYGRVECRNYADQTGRVTRFVALTSWDSGTCLTRDASGRWVPIGQLRVVARAK